MSTLKFTSYNMPAASLGRDNPLPDLGGVGDTHAEIAIDEASVTPEESRYMGWGRVSTILPYTLQDGYSRQRRRRDFKAAVLENEHLRATFLLQLGGRLWSLFDKDAGRELLHVNPVFQPCNLALRNAWISGGVEWNVGIIGHTPFTVDDMACQTLSLSDGTPVLRMFQYERVRHLFYRVEAFLPDGARELYVRVRIDNATKEDTAVYWWSNMAVDEREDVRVIVPADKAFHYGYGSKLSKIGVPYIRAKDGAEQWDISHTTTLPQAMDFFFDVPGDVRPFIAAPGADGYGMCQTSTGELRGRKLFVWGIGEGGRHWQSFLAKEGCQYIELQSGLARTQLEHLPMAGGASISWLESYGPVQADPKRAHDPDWNMAVRAVADALDAQRPADALEAWHARAKAELDGRNGDVAHKGMGYARCEQALLGDAFDTAGLSLDAMRLGDGETPWMTLAKEGVLPCPEPLEEPKSYQTGSAWRRALYESVCSGRSDHWYAHYQLGVMADACGEAEAARASYERSLALCRNPWALRCLALGDMRRGDLGLAVQRLCEAVRMKPIRPLAVEAADALIRAERYEDALALIAELPDAMRKVGRIQVLEIEALIRLNLLDEAEEKITARIVLPDVREGNVTLTDLWFELVARREKGSAEPEAIAWARANSKPPKHLDFRMH